MKRILTVTAIMLLCVFSSNLNAQNLSGVQGKTGYINSDSILIKIPDYKLAQQQLENLANQYKSKIDSDLQKIETLYQNYQSQKARLSEYEKADREADIIRREKEVKELQQIYFGQDGYMQKKSEELLTPIKEKVQSAIDKIAVSGKFMIIFDIAALQGVVYTAPADNLNVYVLRQLGY